MPRHDVLSEATLPKSVQWLRWLNHHLDTMDYEDGWARLARDTSIALLHNVLNCARRLRKNPEWEISGTMRDDTVKLGDEAEQIRSNFLQHRPRLDGIPVRFVKLFDVLEGVVNQQVRLAREIDTMQANGAIDIHVTTDHATARLIEAA